MAAGEQAPLTKKYEIEIPAAAAGADASGAVTVDIDGTVTSVTYIPTATVTGAATNNRTVSVVNHAQDGSGTTSVASLNFASGTNATAYDEKAITLSVVALATTVASGDVLEGRSLHIGTGIAEPGGTLVVSVARA
jgi:hypothetical protein